MPSKRYDPLQAKDILTAGNFLTTNYELSEECISNDGMFTKSGRMELVNALSKHESTTCAGLYMCSTYKFLVVTNNGSFFLIDKEAIGW